MKPGDRVRVRPGVSRGAYRGLEGVITGLESAVVARGPFAGTPTPAAWIRWETRDGLPLSEEERQTTGAFFVLTDLELAASPALAERTAA